MSGAFRDDFTSASLQADPYLGPNSNGNAQLQSVNDPTAGGPQVGEWDFDSGSGPFAAGATPGAAFVTVGGGHLRLRTTFADSDPGVPALMSGFSGVPLEWRFGWPAVHLLPPSDALARQGHLKIGVAAADRALVQCLIADTSAVGGGLVIAQATLYQGVYYLDIDQSGSGGEHTGAIPAYPFYIHLIADQDAKTNSAVLSRDEAGVDIIDSISGAMTAGFTHMVSPQWSINPSRQQLGGQFLGPGARGGDLASDVDLTMVAWNPPAAAPKVPGSIFAGAHLAGIV